MWEEGKTKDAEVQTDQASTELVHSEISPPGLDEAADIDVTAHVLENSPAPVDPSESDTKILAYSKRSVGKRSPILAAKRGKIKVFGLIMFAIKTGTNLC